MRLRPKPNCVIVVSEHPEKGIHYQPVHRNFTTPSRIRKRKRRYEEGKTELKLLYIVKVYPKPNDFEPFVAKFYFRSFGTSRIDLL